jgi:hypothetical protein
MARKEDRRVQRTQQLLRGALLSLIKEKGFEALTVQDVIARANAGRATCRRPSRRGKVARSPLPLRGSELNPVSG